MMYRRRIFFSQHLPCFLISDIFVLSVQHTAESETVDLLMEVDDLDPLTDHVDITKFRKTCLYLTSAARELILNLMMISLRIMKIENNHRISSTMLN